MPNTEGSTWGRRLSPNNANDPRREIQQSGWTPALVRMATSESWGTAVLRPRYAG